MAVLLDFVGLGIGMAVLCEEARKRNFGVALSDLGVVTVVGLVSASHGGCDVGSLEESLTRVRIRMMCQLSDGSDGEGDASSAWCSASCHGWEQVQVQVEASDGMTTGTANLLEQRGIGMQRWERGVKAAVIK